MDDPRACTYVSPSFSRSSYPHPDFSLEALEEFIQAQRSILTRTQHDIERLRALKQDVVDDPQDFLNNLEQKVVFTPL